MLGEKGREFLLGVTSTLAVLFAILFFLAFAFASSLIDRNDKLKLETGCPERCLPGGELK